MYIWIFIAWINFRDNHLFLFLSLSPSSSLSLKSYSSETVGEKPAADVLDAFWPYVVGSYTKNYRLILYICNGGIINYLVSDECHQLRIQVMLRWGGYMQDLAEDCKLGRQDYHELLIALRLIQMESKMLHSQQATKLKILNFQWHLQVENRSY